jgi:hypothetical protein
MEKKPAKRDQTTVPEMVTIKTICKRFKISAPFVHSLDLPRVRFARRCVRYPIKEVNAYVSLLRIGEGE